MRKDEEHGMRTQVTCNCSCGPWEKPYRARSIYLDLNKSKTNKLKKGEEGYSNN